MIGIPDIIDLTAPLHGGKRLTDQVFRADTDAPRTGTATLEEASPTARSTRSRAPLIAMPIIAEELNHYFPARRQNQAA